jgi:hypothetical protein
MKKTIVIIWLMSLNYGFGQSVKLSGNFSNLRANAEIAYVQNFKKWNLGLSAGYGAIGRKEFDFDQKDGYQGVYSPFYLGAYMKRQGFKHNFKGFSFGLNIERRIKLGINSKFAKSEFAVGVGLSYYQIADHFEYYYTLTADESDLQTDKHTLENPAVSIDLSLSYRYALTTQLSISLGVVTPWYAMYSKTTPEYVPFDRGLPLSGFEPYLNTGLIYSFTKSEK